MRSKGRALLLAGLVAGVTVWAAGAEHGRAAATAAKVECKRAGVHYLGTTSQGQKICLTLSPDTRALREYAFGGRFKCGGGTQLGVTHIQPSSTDISVGGLYLLGAGGGGKKIADIGKDGKFSDVPGYDPQSILNGQVKNKAVTGTLRQHVTFQNAPSQTIVCDSGKATWSARRVAK